jgi:hypothetical protein
LDQAKAHLNPQGLMDDLADAVHSMNETNQRPDQVYPVYVISVRKVT